MSAQSFGEWTVDLDDRVGRGGFGQVFAAVDSNGRRAVAKFVPFAVGSDRELLAVTLPPSPHIVPVIASYETDTAHVLLMPRAQMNLRQHIDAKQQFELAEILEILGQIAKGLDILRGVVVHRDLKPENILLLDGSWAICDFGISRYVEASTAIDTRKRSFTMPYAAPEQWLFQHATPATDVYAFGVIAFELLMGQRPFLGPGETDFAEQHTRIVAPLADGPASLVALIGGCLTKAPEARPSTDTLESRLLSARRQLNRPRSTALIAAQQKSVDETAQRAAQERALQAELSRRDGLREAASRNFEALRTELASAIVDVAPNSVIEQSSRRFTISLLDGRLGVDALTAQAPGNGLQGRRPFDVIAYTQIEVVQNRSVRGTSRRSHSLYFCDYEAAGEYAWFELAFSEGRFENAPYSETPDESQIAFAGVFGTKQLAWGAQKIAIEEPQQFVDRWCDYFAAVATNALVGPMMLPEGRTTLPGRRPQ